MSLRNTLKHDRDALRRESAAIVLGTTGDRAAIPLLNTCLKDEKNPWVRAACARALGELGAKDSVSQLQHILIDERNVQVRRVLAQALFHLGQAAGLNELMWQLKTGTQHDKAAVMHFLVRSTGQLFGQNHNAWWRYFGSLGDDALGRRTPGNPVFVELAATLNTAKTDEVPPWSIHCAVRLTLRPKTRVLTRKTIRLFEKRHAGLPDGCVVLLNAIWPPRRTDKRTPSSPSAADKQTGTVTVDAIRYLLKKSPHIIGVGINGSLATDASRTNASFLSILQKKSLLAFQNIRGLSTLPIDRFRLLVISQSSQNERTQSPLLLAMFQ